MNELRAFAFAGSFLMFSAELMVARAILPSFGAGASVWTTCLLFYQGVLILGYLWADVLTSRPMTSRWRIAHVALVVGPVLTFPFHFDRLSLPPIASVLAMLALSVGLSFFTLSTTSVLSQRWLVDRDGSERLDPHFLFGSSNAGALGALVLYPLVIDRGIGLEWQQRCWYGLYAGYAALHYACMPRHGAPRPRAPTASPAVGVRAYWLLLSAAGAALLAGSSNAVTLDASIPLSWMAPLALYLSTFVVCFSRHLPSFGAIVGASVIGLVGASAMVPFAAAAPQLRQLVVVAMHCAVAWCGCLLCHWSLARARPGTPQLLGAYYLTLALGGGLGTALVVVVIPVITSRLAFGGVDYAAFVLLTCGALVLRVRGSVVRGLALPQRSSPAWAGVGLLGVMVVLFVSSAIDEAKVQVHGSRTFYGRYSVIEEGGLRKFLHGSTVHGVESTDPERAGEPLGYYHRGSPMGRLFAADRGGSRVGIVGLGIGAIGAYAKDGDAWDFYELDPEVEVIAREHFGFLSRARGSSRIITGDARLMLASAHDGTYSLLVIDAFSSDFLPAHLATREAVELYLRKCAPMGLVAFNVSSRMFDLVPELSRIASAVGARSVVGGGRDPSSTFEVDVDQGKLPSRWFVLSRDDDALARLEQVGFQANPNVHASDEEAWTDDEIDSLRALSFSAP